MTTEQELVQLRQAVRQNSAWTLGLLIAFIALTAWFLTYQYLNYRRMMQPENLVAMAEKQIEENYPAVREAAKERIIESAPDLAKKLSRKAVASVPEARERLVKFLGRQMAGGLDEATELSAEQFRQLLRENRDLVKEGIEELKKTPARAERFVLNLETRLEKRWDTDIRKDARFLLTTHRALNAKLDRLANAETLAPDELLARRILRIVRAIQVRELGGTEKRVAEATRDGHIR